MQDSTKIPDGEITVAHTNFMKNRNPWRKKFAG